VPQRFSFGLGAVALCMYKIGALVIAQATGCLASVMFQYGRKPTAFADISRRGLLLLRKLSCDIYASCIASH
jgi:hypothetical protein